jgi:hypothetical protein
MEEQDQTVTTSFEIGDYVVCQNKTKKHYGSLFRVVGFENNGRQLKIEVPGLKYRLESQYDQQDFRKVEMLVESEGCFSWKTPSLFQVGDILIKDFPTKQLYLVTSTDIRIDYDTAVHSMPIMRLTLLPEGKETMIYDNEFGYQKATLWQTRMGLE